jgi:hypothetical protein
MGRPRKYATSQEAVAAQQAQKRAWQQRRRQQQRGGEEQQQLKEEDDAADDHESHGGDDAAVQPADSCAAAGQLHQRPPLGPPRLEHRTGNGASPATGEGTGSRSDAAEEDLYGVSDADKGDRANDKGRHSGRGSSSSRRGSSSSSSEDDEVAQVAAQFSKQHLQEDDLGQLIPTRTHRISCGIASTSTSEPQVLFFP